MVRWDGDVLTNDVNNNNAYDDGDEFMTEGSGFRMVVGHLELNNEGNLLQLKISIGLEADSNLGNS